MWLKLYQENNPLVFEINNKILTKINGSIIGAVKVDLKMEKYHISQETHDKIRNNFGHVPVERLCKVVSTSNMPGSFHFQSCPMLLSSLRTGNILLFAINNMQYYIFYIKDCIRKQS
ncbi:hypothetical protein Avbf_00165, partial [Armadillidium vulgare]